jgi:hypothetical protein
MNLEFKRIVDNLPGLLEQLSNKPLLPWANLTDIPVKGIYVFYEEDSPTYVGRSGKQPMKNRIKQHGCPGSNSNTAPFAFNIAKKNAEFKDLFEQAKERVRRMSVRVIEVDDAVVQTLFEVYAAMSLGTMEYNNFSTH